MPNKKHGVLIQVDKELAQRLKRLAADRSTTLQALGVRAFTLMLDGAETDDTETAVALSIRIAAGKALVEAREGRNNFGIFEGHSDSEPETATVGDFIAALRICSRYGLHDVTAVISHAEIWLKIRDASEKEDETPLLSCWRGSVCLDQTEQRWIDVLEASTVARAVNRTLGQRVSQAKDRLVMLYKDQRSGTEKGGAMKNGRE